MKSSIILRLTVRVLLPLLLLFAVFLFMRGHNEPGGGFAGGLVAAAGWALYAIAYGPAEARRALRVDPLQLIGLGLILALGTGLLGLLSSGSFLAAVWAKPVVPGLGVVDLGSPVLFDLGVLLVVLGVTLTIILSLAEAK